MPRDMRPVRGVFEESKAFAADKASADLDAARSKTERLKELRLAAAAVGQQKRAPKKVPSKG